MLMKSIAPPPIVPVAVALVLLRGNLGDFLAIVGAGAEQNRRLKHDSAPRIMKS